MGETAMAAAAFNDVAAWVLLALALALVGGTGTHKSPLIPIWILVSGVAFVAFMLVMVRPLMNWVGRQCLSGPHDILDEAYICLTLVAVMLSGFMTDLIGIHSIFGAFVFGLTIPKGGEFAGRLIKRIEDFVCGLLLPLYFALSGLKTDVAKIRGMEAWGLLAVVISAACAGKIFGTFLVTMLYMVPVRESLTLGVLMNTKGLVELIVLNIGREKKVLNDEMFAILVLMALFTTFMTTPAVMAIYPPARGISSPNHRRSLQESPNKTSEDSQDELRVLACVHGTRNSPTLFDLIESTTKTSMKLYFMQLVEMTNRSSSILLARCARKNGFPCISSFPRRPSGDHMAAAFRAYSQLGRVKVRPMTAISTLLRMHEDICHVAEEKRVAMILLPFHKQWREEGDKEVESLGQGWREVNRRVLVNAPCSVAVLVDRGFCLELQQSPAIAAVLKRVCVLFLGGPDSREALEFGSMMVGHPAFKVSVIRFVENTTFDRSTITRLSSPEKCTRKGNGFSSATNSNEIEKELDHAAVAEFRRRWDEEAGYTEKEAGDIAEEVLRIGKSRDYELIIVGKGGFPPAMPVMADHQPEQAELGPIGDLLASSGQGITSSVLVIGQHNLGHANNNA